MGRLLFNAVAIDGGAISMLVCVFKGGGPMVPPPLDWFGGCRAQQTTGTPPLPTGSVP